MNHAARAWMEATGEDQTMVAGVLDVGFEVYHLNGDRSDLEPENLILVWGGDVGKLEGMVVEGEVDMTGRPSGVGERSYALRERGKTWSQIGGLVGTTPVSALGSAKAYSKTHNKPWPIGR